MPILRAAILCAVIANPACLPSEPGGSGQIVQSLIQCDKDDCGNGNSPVIDGVYFWMLHSGGTPNQQGVAIESVQRSDGAPMQLVAVHDQLLGRNASGVIAANTGLIGTKIRVTVKGQRYQIRIVDVTLTSDNTEHFWVGAQSRVEAYVFNYAPLLAPTYERAGDERPLCSLANQDPLDPMIRAIVFTGDNYDPITKQITLGIPTEGWMNIACQKSAPYKMHLIGHTDPAAAKLPGISTSLAQRRAMLNAWTMNACGTGRAFTEPGTPITLTESQKLLPIDSPYQAPSGSIEAIWGEDGAVCLDVHRLADSAEENDQIKAEIEAECGRALPSCAAMLATWTDSGDVLTGTPLGPILIAPP